MDRIREIYTAACVANSCDDLLLMMYEIAGNETGGLTVISPCWKPMKVLCRQQVEIVTVAEHTAFATYRIRFANTEKWFSWIYCAPGASNIMDVCLPLFNSSAKHLLFIGSAGTLDSQLKIGQTVLVSSAETVIPMTDILNTDSFEHARFDIVFAEHNELRAHLCGKAGREMLALNQVRVFSTPSIVCEYIQKEALKNRNIQCVEMETYSFFRTAAVINKHRTALLCISDSIDTDRGLLNRDATTREQYLIGREVMLPIILRRAVEFAL